jgi:type II restriction enzyme
MTANPGLYGLVNTNRDFTDAETWGKNQFNSSFPTALGCYMHSKGLKANYLNMVDGSFEISEIAIDVLYGQDPLSADVLYAFESAFVQLQPLVIGRLPNTDLVVSSNSNPSDQSRALEIKLTALPDKATSLLAESEYGSELVVRPDTIFYLCATLFEDNRDEVKKLFAASTITVEDWTEPSEVLAVLPDIRELLYKISKSLTAVQSPVLMQPVWKTIGQTPLLADHCLDLFAWSSLGFLDFILDIGEGTTGQSMTRSMRTVVWVYKVLEDLGLHSKTNFSGIVDELSFNTKNDKAFAASGRITKRYMAHDNLTKPRIKKEEIKNIVTGGGQNYLSPERRFDAILVNSPEIFS